MKIMLIEPYGLAAGHFSFYTERLAKNLISLGHQVTLLTASGMISDCDQKLSLFKNIRALDGSKHIVGYRKAVFFWRLYTSFFVCLKALKEIKNEDYDAIHFIDCEFILITLFTYLQKGKQKVLFNINAIHEFYKSRSGSFHKWLYLAINRKCLQYLSKKAIPIVHSITLKAELVRKVKISEHLISIIPWGNDCNCPVENTNALRSKLGFAENKKILLFCGTIRSDKGVDILLESLKYLNKKEIILVIAGKVDDTYDFNLSKKITEIGWDNNIVLHLNYIPDDLLNMFFHVADCVILPYRKSFLGDSGILTTAIGHLCPVIASDIGEIGRKVKDYRIGLLFEPNDPLHLSDKIRTFLNLSKYEINTLKDNMLNFNKIFSWENVAKKHLDLYGK